MGAGLIDGLISETMDFRDFPSSLAARGGNLAKIPPNEVIDDFGRGSSVESETE